MQAVADKAKAELDKQKSKGASPGTPFPWILRITYKITTTDRPLLYTPPPPKTARDATDKAEKAMDEGVSKAKGLFGSLKNALK